MINEILGASLLLIGILIGYMLRSGIEPEKKLRNAMGVIHNLSTKTVDNVVNPEAVGAIKHLTSQEIARAEDPIVQAQYDEQSKIFDSLINKDKVGFS